MPLASRVQLLFHATPSSVLMVALGPSHRGNYPNEPTNGKGARFSRTGRPSISISPAKSFAKSSSCALWKIAVAASAAVVFKDSVTSQRSLAPDRDKAFWNMNRTATSEGAHGLPLKLIGAENDLSACSARPGQISANDNCRSTTTPAGR